MAGLAGGGSHYEVGEEDRGEEVGVGVVESWCVVGEAAGRLGSNGRKSSGKGR